MIKVKIDLDVFGHGLTIKRLHDIEIWNTGQGTRLRGEYRYIIHGRKEGKLIAEGEIKNWPRTSKTAVALLAAVLRDANV